MEDFEEMKQNWNLLAEKNSVDSETNKKILESIRENRYKSLKGKMLKEGKICLILIMAMMIFIPIDRCHHIVASRSMHELSFWVNEGLGLSAFIAVFGELLYVYKLDFSMTVTELRRKISNYKKYLVYSYCILAPVYLTIILGTMTYTGDIQLQNTGAKIRLLFVILLIGCFSYPLYRHEIKNTKQLEKFIDDEE